MKHVANTLAIIIALWFMVAIVWATDGDSHAVEPKTSLLDTACTGAYQLAVNGGVVPLKCRLVEQAEEGQTATITVKVKIQGQGWFNVSSAYQQSIWGQTAISVTPVG